MGHEPVQANGEVRLPAIRLLLEAHLDSYTEILADRFSRQLRSLAEGLAG